MILLALLLLLLPSVALGQTVNAKQSGTWNITNVSGTVSLPTGAATETTLGTRLADATFTGRFPAAFASADAIASQTATFMHGGLMGWNGTGWDRLQVDGSKNLKVAIQNASIAVTGTFWQATQPVSGTVTANAGTGTFFDGIIRDGTGDTTQANVSSGSLHVNLQTALPAGTNNIGDVDVLTLPAIPAGNNNIGDVDIATLPNEGTQTAANSISVTIASDIASGATTIPTAAAQGLVVRQPAACTSYAAISQTADTAVITATASQYIYICSIILVAGAAETVSIWEGTGTACGTGSAAMFGSTTETSGMAFAANGGFTMVSGQPFVRTASTNVDLCVRQNGTNRVSGMISYIKAP